MPKTLTTAATLVAVAAAFAAVAAGGTRSTAQSVRIEAKGTDPFAFVLKPTSHGRVQRDADHRSYSEETWSPIGSVHQKYATTTS